MTCGELDVAERLYVMESVDSSESSSAIWLNSVSYTHLDVYKRQKENIVQVLKEYQKNKNIELLSEDTIDIDRMTAYYGSPSPLICRFVEQHKPAMVSESLFK